MLVVPQPETAFVDPFMAQTLVDDLQHSRSDHPRETMPKIRAMWPARRKTT